jgi:hypothetical protein
MEHRENVPWGGWVGYAVYALDRIVRKRVGIYEYSADDLCLFRVHLDRADHSLSLKDGTHIHRGDPILKLHIWNEHMPCMGKRGPSVAWGRQVSRCIDVSLKELARYLQQESAVSDVNAVCADMCLGTAEQRQQLARIVGRYGFESARDGLGEPGVLERVGQNIMMWLLVLVTNPSTLRGAILLRAHQRIFLSRAALVGRYSSRTLTHDAGPSV